MPLYNKTEQLKEALESLLAQTFTDFCILVLDDSSNPEPRQIVERYADADARIRYVKNPRRLGMIDNWRACVKAADGFEYFAWVSDHDLWAPTWLEKLVIALEKNPRAVLAYPLTEYLDNDHSLRKKKRVHTFSTAGQGDAERVLSTIRKATGFGNMIYGLYRTHALLRAGVFRHLVAPDVILILELSFLGEFHQVEEGLWRRRQTDGFSISRQKKNLFRRRPWYVFLPWPLVNTCALIWNLCIRSGTGSIRKRFLGFAVALSYLKRYIGKLGEGSLIGSYYEWRHGKKPWVKRLKKRVKNRMKSRAVTSDDTGK
jgi:glycosyltransferase involved in cell wall biosynthesis